MTDNKPFDINQLIIDVQTVITNPAGYYRAMEKTGGFVNPLVFVAVMGAVSGLVAAILSIISSPVGMFAYGFFAIVAVPIGAVIGSFICAGVLFVIWKLMGSEHSYETAYRCFAGSMAVYPITMLLALIPYLGAIIGIAWGCYLMIEASVAVHSRERKTANIVFGVIAAVLVLINISTEIAARKVADRAEEMSKMMEDYQNLPAEEQGKQIGEFLKGLEQGMEKQQ